MIRFILACITIGSIIGIILLRTVERVTGTDIPNILWTVIGFVLTSIMINVGGKLLYD